MLKHKSQTECYLNKKELPKDQRIAVCFICLSNQYFHFKGLVAIWRRLGGILCPTPTKIKASHPSHWKLRTLLIDTKNIFFVFRMECWDLIEDSTWIKRMAFGGACLSILFRSFGERPSFELSFCVCVWPYVITEALRRYCIGFYDHHGMQCFWVQCTSYIADFNARFNKRGKKWALEH